jgi:type II secretory ATPase GspE/PulE/Tfp pilus assembly ATPase PilB-like protein
MLRELGAEADKLRGARLAYGKGCEACFHTGYRGRTAILEVMQLDEALRRAVLANMSTAEIRKRACSAGMTELRDSGIACVLAGVTTLEEVIRETMGTW